MNLWLYSLRRMLYSIPIFFGVCLIIFIFFNLFSPDPAKMILGKHASVEQIQELRDDLGLNRSLPVQYFDIVTSAFSFNFGHSWDSKQEISEMLSERIVPTLAISLPGFLISTIISICIALLVARWRDGLLDRFVIFFCAVTMSISSLVYILIGQWALAYKLQIFELSGYDPSIPGFLSYVILPIIIWVLMSLGQDVRFYRTVFLDEMHCEYVRTAYGKGLSERSVLSKHILKNAMIPVLTYVLGQIPFLILGALLIENFFGIPGIGSMTFDAVNSADFPVIKAITIIFATIYIVFNLLADILYVIVDPRVRMR